MAITKKMKQYLCDRRKTAHRRYAELRESGLARSEAIYTLALELEVSVGTVYNDLKTQDE